MNWKILDSREQFSELLASATQPVFAVFKHSTRCSISVMSKNRIERKWDVLPENFDLYFVDLLTYRPLSDAIADELNVEHESPQLLLIAGGECIYHSSHSEISVELLAEKIRLFQN